MSAAEIERLADGEEVLVALDGPDGALTPATVVRTPGRKAQVRIDRGGGRYSYRLAKPGFVFRPGEARQQDLF